MDPRGGAVAIVQRFGGALNLKVHIYALVLDGVFALAADGRLAFHAASHVTDADVADVLEAITPGVTRLLTRLGLADDGDRSDDCAEATPLLAGLTAASVQGVVALGKAPGTRPRQPGKASESVREPARVCRYTLRPPVADERLHRGAGGQVVLQLRHPWTDGTTSLAFEPTTFLERLAVLVPRPRIDLVLYHGVLVPRAAWRAEVVRRQTRPARARPLGDHAA